MRMKEINCKKRKRTMIYIFKFTNGEILRLDNVEKVTELDNMYGIRLADGRMISINTDNINYIELIPSRKENEK